MARTVPGLAVLLLALFILPGLGSTPLVDWDEGIYGEVAREVFAGRPLELHWNGEPYYRKPPLLFWLIAIAYRIFGINEWAVRLPSAVAGLGTVALVASVVARRSGPGAALASAACLIGSGLFLERGGRRACTDALLMLFTVVSLSAAHAPSRRRRVWGAGLAAGLAILAKGPLGLLAPAALFLSSLREPERRLEAITISCLAFGVAAPWYAAQLAIGGEPFVFTHFGREIFRRIVEPLEGHEAPWWYPLSMLWSGGGLWVAPAGMLVLVAVLGERHRFVPIRPWIIAAILVLGASVITQTRLPWYPLPALPMLAVAAGLALGVLRAQNRGWLGRGLRDAFLVSAVVALLSAPQARRALLAGERQFEAFRAFGTKLAAVAPDDPFLGATEEVPTLVFYGGRRIYRFDPEELERLLLDPTVLPQAGIVPADRAASLLDAGAVEIGRVGNLVLVSNTAR